MKEKEKVSESIKPNNGKKVDLTNLDSINDQKKLLDLEKAQILSTSFWDNDTDKIWND